MLAVGTSTSHVSRRLVHLRSSADGAQLRTGTMYGTQYIVVPCVSKLGNNVEFPVNAPTPEYIPSHVLAFLTESRNNRPVVMGHPRVNGEYVSANTPDILDTYAYGYMYGAQFVDGEVRCELWLDSVRAALVDGAARVIERLQNGEVVEVSEGDYVIVREETGEHGGKAYGGVWEFCASDHLATLREDEVGACSVADGCGALRGSQTPALRSSVLSVARTLDGQVGNVTGVPTLRTSALSQARRPTYTGTETGTWSKPTFADYVKYQFNGDVAPTSVSQCSAEFKRSVASHTLLGDPDAGNFSDLSFFPVVNPSTGKLNENALRSVLSGRGATSDLPESALTSAQDMATRLLNSEFSANLETSTSTSTSSEDTAMNDAERKQNTNMFGRMMTSLTNMFKASMSSNTLRNKLYKALEAIEPGLSYVEDEDPDTKTVVYCVRVFYGDFYDYSKSELTYWQRTFTLDANENVTVNDDRQAVEYTPEWKVVAEPAEVTVSTSASSSTSPTPAQDCQCGKSKGESTMDVTARTALIRRLCGLATGPFKGQEAGLQAMSDETLTALDKAYPDGTTAPPAQAAQPATPPAAVQAGPTVTDLDTGVVTETVSIPKEDYEVMKASATAFQRSQEERKTRLVTALKTAQTEFTEADLRAMSVEQVDRLARAFKVDVSGVGSDPSDTRFDYSGARPAVSGGVRRRTPDTYGLRAAEEKKNAAKTATN